MQNNSVSTPLSTSEGEQTNGGIHNNGGLRQGTASEAVYDVPQAMDSVEDENCYSSLGPIDYSTLQPHIPKPTRTQLTPPNNDEYSCLQHL